MAKPYFRYIPEVNYVDRRPDSSLNETNTVKNFFRRGKVRQDILENIAYFTKYTIFGDDRPDNVAFKVYGDATLDWVVLTANNIMNVNTEWPKTQQHFDEYLLRIYGSYENIYSIRHYKSREVKNSLGVTIFPEGLIVDENFSLTFYDDEEQRYQIISDIAQPVTNYEYEQELEDAKRQIFVLKPLYLGIILDDMENVLKYQRGSTQYVSETLINADNIRLYQ